MRLRHSQLTASLIAILALVCQVRAHFVPPLPFLSDGAAALLRRASKPDVTGKRHFLQRRSAQITTTDETSTSFADCLASKMVDFVTEARNGSLTFQEAHQSENVLFDFVPIAVVFPTTVQGVQQAVLCAAQNGNIQTVARSGGHSFAGFSQGGRDGALIVDLRNMTKIKTDGRNGLVHLEPGAMLGDVVKSLWADGKRATSHGTCPTVAIGGHGLCGGFGPTSHRWGMTIDNVVEAEIVLANGTLARASQHENLDLWWAIKGAGSFFGIVTSFVLTTYDASAPSVTFEHKWTESITSPEDAVDLFLGIQEFSLSSEMPNTLGFYVSVEPGHDQPIAVHMRGVYLGPLDEAKETLSHLEQCVLARKRSVSKPDSIYQEELTFPEVMGAWDDFAMGTEKLDTLAERANKVNFYQHSAMTMGRSGLSRYAFQSIFEKLWQHETEKRLKWQKPEKLQLEEEGIYSWNVYFEMYGAPKSRILDPEVRAHSSFVHRDGLWLIQASIGSYPSIKLTPRAIAFLDNFAQDIYLALERDGIERRGFSCYTDPTLKDWKDVYYNAETIARLVSIKQQVDPANLFRTPQSLLDTADSHDDEGDDGLKHAKSKDKDKSTNDGVGKKLMHPLPRR